MNSKFKAKDPFVSESAITGCGGGGGGYPTSVDQYFAIIWKSVNGNLNILVTNAPIMKENSISENLS